MQPGISAKEDLGSLNLHSYILPALSEPPTTTKTTMTTRQSFYNVTHMDPKSKAERTVKNRHTAAGRISVCFLLSVPIWLFIFTSLSNFAYMYI